MDRFNLEFNLTPAPLAGRPFAAMAGELDQALGLVRRAAARHGGRIVMVGILPTLRAEELRLAALSDAARFRALNNGIRRLRQEPFRIRIDGADPLELAADDIGLEGANTSFQVHLKVDPRHFASHFNAAQLAIGPVLAVAGNSPTFLGHRLWEETRVALFKQAVDDRDAAGRSSRRICRVAFGTGWIATGAMELLEESVRLHEPVLPVLSGERPLERVAAGQVPALEELRLHQSTVWRWNRAIYDPAGGGHLRIEARALPAGPTVVDMLANAAFLLGLTLALAPDADAWVRQVPFRQAHRNFYRAAQLGLRAELGWPLGPGGRMRPVPAPQLIRRLLPVARQGLEDGRGRARGGRRAAGRGRGAGGHRPDRRRLATPDPGRPGTAAGPRASAGGDAGAVPGAPADRRPGPHLADPGGPELPLSGGPSRVCYRRRAAKGSSGLAASTRTRASTTTTPSGSTLTGLQSSSAISGCASTMALTRSSSSSRAATSALGAPR